MATVLQHVQLAMNIATPWFFGVAAGFFVLWLVVRCHEVKPFAKEWEWFNRLSLGRKFLAFTVVCLFTLWGGSKNRGIPLAGDSGNMPPISRVGESFQLRTLPEEISTNALAITGFAVDSTNRIAYFETCWAPNLFDYTDSCGLFLFASTNLLERQWSPLGMYTMPEDTNVCAFLITGNDVIPSMRDRFLYTFDGIGFYRFGVDFDTDGDGLADDIEKLWIMTDPLNPDTDGDGLSDGEELSPDVNTDPFVSDTDADGVCDGDEVASGADPHTADSDSDGIADAAELGTMTVLAGEDFVWFDMSDGMDLLSDYVTNDSDSWLIPLSEEIVVNNVCYTNARVCLDGTVYLLCPTNSTNSDYWNYSDDLRDMQWSASHITVAVYSSDLYARTSEWGSKILYGSVESGGRTFDVIEYRDIGHWRYDETYERITCQLILPHDETNTVYVSYLCASNVFRMVERTAGVQCGWMRSWKSGETYYNLSWPITDDFPADGLTVKYRIGTGTDPVNEDTDGDGLSDVDEFAVYFTNPLVADTDGDGMPDDVEVSIGTHPCSADTDGDGMPDGWEVENGLNPLVDDSALDPDGDGLSNFSEYGLETNPAEADTDEDGIGDREELGWWEYASALPVFSYSTVTNLISPSLNYDDDNFLVHLPFAVQFAGHRATNAVVSVNGFVWLVTEGGEIPFSSDYANLDLSAHTRSEYHGFIAAYWDDLYAYSGRNAQLSVSDAFANGQRYCVVKYQNISIRGDASNVGTFSVIIPESETNTVYVAYDSLASGFNGSSATIGAQSPNRSCNFHVAYNESGSVSNGMVIAYHFGTGSNPLVADTDGDGLEDGAEVAAGTNPLLADTDGDGLLDGWEVSNALNPTSATEDDGPFGDLDGDGLDNMSEQIFGGDPRLADTDGDGLTDAQEVQYGTNLSDSDTDKDGLTDKQEVDAGYNPLDCDMDRDGMPDGWEDHFGLNPVSAAGGDGADGDLDGDGLSNIDEYLNGTDPTVADTDGDGVSDAVEIAHETDPCDSSDGGQPPATDRFREIAFNIGGDYAAWEMTVEGIGPEDRRIRRISMGQPNAANTTVLKVRKGNAYRLTMRWLNCDGHDDEFAPWYCWQARLDGKPWFRSFGDYSENRLDGNEVVVGNGWIADNEDGLLTSHVHECTDYNGWHGGGNVAGRLMATLYVLDDPKLIPDYNRDRVINDADETKADQKATFRFWINDDEDEKSTDGKYAESSVVDRPGAYSGAWEFDGRDPDWSDRKVNGYRDLIDFTPVYMDVSLIQSLPEWVKNNLTFKLRHDSAAVNVVWTGLPKSSIASFQRDGVYTCGRRLNENSFEATTAKVKSNGVAVPAALATQMKASPVNMGVVFIEGRKDTTSPLMLDVYYNDQKVVSSELPLHLSSVEEMYWFYSLHGAEDAEYFNLPDHYTPGNLMDNPKDCDVFFTHGFNVSEEDARAWGSEIFKRLWQSGSDARFHMVAWPGNYHWTGNWANGLHYQRDVYQALKSANAFKRLVEREQGDSSKRVITAQSLGNMMACEAFRQGLAANQYFMFDAAVASEAIDAVYQDDSQTTRAKYVPSDWADYHPMSWAANWHKWFKNDVSDFRGKMGWSDYFKDALTNVVNVYNYYSSGDPVFMERATVPDVLTGVFHWPTFGWSWWPSGPTLNWEITAEANCWQKQETHKGVEPIAGNLRGGWGFYYWEEMSYGQSYIEKYSAATTSVMVANGSITNNPVFYYPGTQMDNRNASQNDIWFALAEYVPVISSPVGGNPVGNDVTENIDMNDDSNDGILRPNGWGRNSGTYGTSWFHSDMKDMAYFYVYPLYDELKTKGNLK